jgi:hypothetical protein
LAHNNAAAKRPKDKRTIWQKSYAACF